MKALLILSFIAAISSAMAYAGGSSGGGFPVKLEEMALSETMMRVDDLASLTGGSLGGGGAIESKSGKPQHVMMESETQDSGFLISVSSTDFEKVVANVPTDDGITYREVALKAISTDQEGRTVTLGIEENSGVVIVVKDSGL